MCKYSLLLSYHFPVLLSSIVNKKPSALPRPRFIAYFLIIIMLEQCLFAVLLQAFFRVFIAVFLRFDYPKRISKVDND